MPHGEPIREPGQCQDDYQERTGFGFFHPCPNRARWVVYQINAVNGSPVQSRRVCGVHKRARLYEWGRYARSEPILEAEIRKE
jgi:hypothetical protein